MGESKEFKSWARNMALKMKGMKTLDDRVDEQMAEQNLLVEVWSDGEWRPTKREALT
jgi:hypothetical protein